MTHAKIMLRLVSLLLRRKWDVCIAVVGTIVQVTGALYLPILIGQAIDVAFEEGKVNFVSLSVILGRMLIVILFVALAQWWTPRAYSRMTYEAMRDLRQSLFAKIHRLPIGFLDVQTVGDLLSRLTTDTEQLSDGILMVFNQLLSGILMIVGVFIMMARLDGAMMLLVITLTPLSLIVARFIAQKSYQLFKQQTLTRGAQTQFVEESINQQTVIQLLNGQSIIFKQFQQLNAQYAHYSQQAIFYSSTVNPMTRFVNALIYALSAGIGAWRIVHGALSVGELTVFLNYANQYTKPFNDISGVLSELQGAIACAERLFELLDVSEREATGGRSIDSEILQGQIEFQSVTFSYHQGQNLINDLNFNAPAGSRIAIVGPTGAGKSTLINLLMRFYDVQKGAILLDGVPITTYDLTSLREQIGMVLQDTWLVSGSIHDNIAFAAPHLTREQVIHAAKMAHADTFIRQLPQGYDTHLIDADNLLSQGQRQLLAIARVFALKPKILLLDEATASIDTRTELLVQQALEQLMVGRTSFIIAHRLSTIQSADLILVMDKGQIVEQGTHDTLMAQQGFYWQMQQTLNINHDLQK
ncbi:ABC transporter ATP-binding protein/permease [Aerococcaceae bacterium NML180378]|nr:ABC transporter ATP-binding protein/permease [Aerococcaceae bacterium NML180378]